ncbi:hypothetical protein HU200_028512 [Digitaria exilis]|uniref:Uncharacterized protein n=1 Tax=Digitaria exilis TaxID=1010633 RepID=A0A835BVE4_9POAL|nr:hypothetical protein HU200_028512 [Digitaria exilis]
MEEHYKPPHLLGHLWFVLRCNLMPPHSKGESMQYFGDVRQAGPISAVELMHAGFKLTASAGWFAYMKCRKRKLPFSGELSLSPLLLDETMACRLVNLAALESVQAASSGLSQHLRLGYKYLNTLGEIDQCSREKKVSIAIRKFFCNNYKAIAAVLSIAGALIGVLKALYSLKKP